VRKTQKKRRRTDGAQFIEDQAHESDDEEMDLQDK
jgi:hypothetical protein